MLKQKLAVVLLISACVMPLSGYALTLKQAEQLAIQHDSTLAEITAHSEQLKNEAVAADQLSDPKMSVGAMNVPTDSFSFSQEPMTQLQVGIMQQFPHGHSLYYQSLAKTESSTAFKDSADNQQLLLKQRVRQDWIKLYYWRHHIAILRNQVRLDKQLSLVAESLLANNKTNQQAVLDAQLRVSNLKDDLIQANEQYRLTVDDLGRWIGRRAAAQVRVNSLENIAPLPRHKLSCYIHQHPLLRRDSALIASSKSMFRWAEQQKIPAFAIGMNYGYRQGRNMDGSRRSQFVSASVTFDLPLFSSNRQDKVISANENKIQAAESARQTEYRNMLKMFYEERHIIEHSSQRIHLLQTQIVPRAQEFAESSLTAYQNNQVDFLSISKAYQAQLKAKLDLLKARVKRAQAFVMLEYLRGK